MDLEKDMKSKHGLWLNRRDFVKGIAGAGLTLAAGNGFCFAKRHYDDLLLDDLARRCFQFFWDASDPETGICRDLIHGMLRTTRTKAMRRAGVRA